MENRNLQSADYENDVTTWALPKQAIARLGRGYVQAVAHASNKDILAVGSRIGVWLYDTSTMMPLTLWETQRGLIAAVVFSPNGDLLATSNWDGDIKIWDVQSLRCISKMERAGRFNVGCQLTFSMDGQHLASSNGCYLGDPVCIWNVVTGEQLARFTVEEKSAPRSNLITFSPDGSLLAGMTRGGVISVWDIAAGERIASLPRRAARVRSLIFSPCGQHLISGEGNLQAQSAGGDAVLQKWNVNQLTTKNSNPFVSTLPAEKGWVKLAYSSDNTLLAAAVSHEQIVIWDVDSNKELGTLVYQQGLRVMEFSMHYASLSLGEQCGLPVPTRPTKNLGLKLLIGGIETIQIWNFEEPASKADVIHGHTYSGESVKFSPVGEKLVSTGHVSRLWDVEAKRSIRLPMNFSVSAMHFTDYETLQVAGPDKNGVSVCEIGKNGELKRESIHNENLLWLTKNRVVYRGNQKLFTLETGEMAVQTYAFSPDGSQLVVALENRNARRCTTEVWNVKQRKHIGRLPLTRQSPVDLYRGDVQTIENTLAKKYDSGILGDIGPMGLTFSPCGNLIAGGLPAAIRLWDAITYETVMVICPPIEYLRPYALAFSPCGQFLASGGWWFGLSAKVPIQLWEVATGENIATFWGHPTDIQCLAFSPDGTVLASGSFDGTILLWDVTHYLQNEKS